MKDRKNTKLNKHKIRYFVWRVEEIEEFKIVEINSERRIQKSEESSINEKLEQIRLGTAVLKKSITFDNCVYARLLDCFEYKESELIEATKLGYGNLYSEITGDIKNYAITLKASIVNHHFETPMEVELALRQFNNKDFVAQYLK